MRNLIFKKKTLQVGDKLISVNGHTMVGTGHYEAVEILRSAGPVLDIVVLREVTRLLPLHKVILNLLLKFCQWYST